MLDLLLVVLSVIGDRFMHAIPAVFLLVVVWLVVGLWISSATSRAQS